MKTTKTRQNLHLMCILAGTILLLAAPIKSFKCSPNCMSCLADTCLYCFDSQFDETQTNCDGVKATDRCEVRGTTFPSRCLICKDGYNLAFGRCFPFSPDNTIPGCRNGIFKGPESDYSCELCKDGLCPNLEDGGKTCVKDSEIDPNCDWCRAKLGVRRCYKCKDGFVLDRFSGKCKKKEPHQVGCLEVGLKNKCFICDSYAGYGMRDSFSQICSKFDLGGKADVGTSPQEGHRTD